MDLGFESGLEGFERGLEGGLEVFERRFVEVGLEGGLKEVGVDSNLSEGCSYSS